MSRLRSRLRLLKPKILEWLSVVLIVALIIVPLSILAWLIFFTDTFIIHTITIVDAREHTAEKIQLETSDLTGKNILLIQPEILERSLSDSIFQINNVRVVRKLPSAIKIVVQEKQPSLLLVSGGKYHFVDRQGIAYEEARLDTLPGIVLPVIKNTGEHSNVVLGTAAVSEPFVTFILEAQNSLPDATRAQIAEIRIPSLAAREVHILLTTNWLIRFDTSRPLSSQLSVLKRLLEHTIPEESRDDIEYIDLRIPNRVYYKLRGVSAVTE